MLCARQRITDTIHFGIMNDLITEINFHRSFVD